MEQYLASVGESLAATQKEKDALVASLTAQKDTFPSMTPLSPCEFFHYPFTHSFFVFFFFCLPSLFFSRQADQVPDVRKDLR